MIRVLYVLVYCSHSEPFTVLKRIQMLKFLKHHILFSGDGLFRKTSSGVTVITALDELICLYKRKFVGCQVENENTNRIHGCLLWV